MVLYRKDSTFRIGGLMRAVDIIRKKRDGLALAPAEIDAFVTGASKGSWPDYQVSALLMAIVLRGMDAAETAHLTTAMVDSGKRLNLSDLAGPKVDKHSTGGVGDKTSLVLAPLAAACGVVVPMMSGRGLAHTGGTLDKLEAIPGFRVNLTLEEFHTALRRVGCAMVGQSEEIAPADKKLYALRDVTATVDSLPLICGSIMSKKIAEGIEGLVLDVKCGSGTFMKTHADARRLAESLIANGRANNVRTEAVITRMDVPLGRTVGNALEVREAIEILQGRGEVEVRQIVVFLATRMVLLAGLAVSQAEAEVRVASTLSSGAGLEKLRAIIQQQGGDPRVIDDPTLLPAAPQQLDFCADRSGYWHGFEAEQVGRAAVLLGAGRDRADQPVDPAVGIEIHAPPRTGHKVRAGERLATLHYRDPSRLEMAQALLTRAAGIHAAPPNHVPPILEILT
jgi:pyrimidine-nucleoside phosphorylase